MTWVDLLIVCLFLWGGVTGYLAGWKRTIFRLVALLAAVLFAMTFKSDMTMIIGEHYPIEQNVKEVIDGRLALPVGTSRLSFPVILTNIGVPRVLYRPLLDQQRLHEPVDFIRLGDRLTCIMTDLIAFISLFILWWVVLSLFVWIYSKSLAVRVSRLERWGGAVAGVLTQLLVISLVLGALSPLLWLVGINPDLSLDKGPLARIGLHLFEQLKLP